MKSFIEALNHPAEAFLKGNKTVSWVLVIITILINSVFEPVLQHFCGIGSQEIDVLTILKVTGLGILSYIAICLIFWVVCKCFGSKVTLMSHISTWGMSYYPTAICSVVVAVTEVFFFVFWNNTIWGMLLNIVFIGVLIWKAILYLIYLRKFANLKGWHLFGTFVVIGFLIIIMVALNGYVGLKTPIL